MSVKYALLMDMPEGKLPGFYAQIVKALAAKAPLFDRDKEMLVFAEEATREAAEAVMDHYKIGYELLELVQLPEPFEISPAFTDFGFVSRSEHAYAYADQVVLFRLAVPASGGEPAQAVAQLEEHLLARCGAGEQSVYAALAHLAELMQRIAGAYGCSVEFVSGGS